MPKQTLNIEGFHGGLNTNADPRDIQDNQSPDSIDVAVDSLGRIKTLGSANQDDANTNNLLIGHCGLYYINWTSRTAEFGIYIGDKEYRKGGYGSDALRTLISYGFNDLNMNRIWCEVYNNNEGALEVYKHVGFIYEGKLRENYYNEGKYWDSHIMGMLKNEYNKKYNNT